MFQNFSELEQSYSSLGKSWKQ